MLSKPVMASQIQSVTTHLAILGNTPALSALELERLGVLKHWAGGRVAELKNINTGLNYIAGTEMFGARAFGPKRSEGTRSQSPVGRLKGGEQAGDDESARKPKHLVPAKAIHFLMNRLGGTIKIAEVLGEIPRSLENLDQLKKILRAIPVEHKLRFGFSVYSGDADVTEKVTAHYAKKLKRVGIDWKKELRTAGAQIRYVESQEAALSSVIVHKEHLLEHQTDFVLAVHKKNIVLARTIVVQDYQAFSRRDYGRPERDHASGMLPPKVARMMVNIAAGAVNISHEDTSTTETNQPVILDPFCGSGTVLQEALDIGFTNVIGSDISKKCIEDSQANLSAMNLPTIPLHEIDVRQIHTILEPASVDCVVAEGYLGPTRPKKTDKIERQMLKLYTETFATLPKIVKPGARVVLAIPAWKRYDRTDTLDLTKTLAANNFTEFHAPIFYGRESAKVLRQIYFLTYNN